MLLTKAKEGARYRINGRPTIHLVRYRSGSGEFEERVVVPSSTVMTVLRKNDKSLRVKLKFRDRDKGDVIARVQHRDNPQAFDAVEVA